MTEVGGEAAVAGCGAVGDGRGGVFQPFFEASSAGDEAAMTVGADLVEGGGRGFDGEKLVAENQGGGGGAGSMGDLPGARDVGGGRGGGFGGAGGGVSEVDGAVEAGFGGDDALGGKSDAEADGEVEGGAKSADDAEAVQSGGGVEGMAVVHGGMMAELRREGKEKVNKFK